MKINKLTLTNIGPYVGKHCFDLSTSTNKNVVLIGGKNGSGKTTFLKSIKMGLFGCYSLGLKNETSQYWKEVEELLNNKCAGPFSISIEIQYVENFVLKNMIVERSWIKNNESLTETITVYMSGKKMSEYESHEMLEKIKSLTSPQLINSYIYDGEKIASAVLNDTISSYLEETFDSMFGVNLLDQSVKDIGTYLSKLATESEVKDFQDNVIIINKINSLKTEIKLLNSNLSQLKKNRADIVSIRKSNVEKFIKLGGLTKTQFQEIQLKLNKVEKNKEEISKEVREFVETDFPLYICEKLLKESIIQIEKEQGSKYIKNVKDIESLLGINLSNVIEQLNERFDNCELIHNLSEESISIIRNKAEALETRIVQIQKSLSSRAAKQDEYKILKQAIKRNENSEEIDAIISAIETNDRALTSIDEEIRKLEIKISEKNKELEIDYSVFEKITEEIKKNNAESSSIVLANNSIVILNKAKELITDRKRTLVSNLALEIFNSTVGKSDYLSNITINKDFSLQVFNVFGKEINPKILSAGETQILISSLIWAMFKISGRKEMFVFDTPLARLDKTNRKNFINNIVLTISDQVIILSTDSEFVDDNYKLVESKANHVYLLEYDDLNAETKVSNNYFRGAKK